MDLLRARASKFKKKSSLNISKGTVLQEITESEEEDDDRLLVIRT